MNNNKSVSNGKPVKRGRGRPPKKPKVEEFQDEDREFYAQLRNQGQKNHSSLSGGGSVWGQSKLVGADPPPRVKVTTIRAGHPKFSSNGSLLDPDGIHSSDRANQYTGQVFKVRGEDYEKIPAGGGEL